MKLTERKIFAALAVASLLGAGVLVEFANAQDGCPNGSIPDGQGQCIHPWTGQVQGPQVDCDDCEPDAWGYKACMANCHDGDPNPQNRCPPGTLPDGQGGCMRPWVGPPSTPPPPDNFGKCDPPCTDGSVCVRDWGRLYSCQ